MLRVDADTPINILLFKNFMKITKTKDLLFLEFHRDFMQEYSDEADVAEFCSTEYGVDFPMFATSKVRGSKANPLYKN